MEELPTETSDHTRGREETARALYVTGPKNGARHILPDGLVCLGRGSESTIVIDDPRVSRAHAALHVDGDISLSDLGSANGTFLGDERLTPGHAQPVALGQTFFVGDSALVVRSTSLRLARNKRVSGYADIHQRFAALPSPDGESPRMVMTKVRPLRPTQMSVIEAILGDLLESPGDWLWWAGAGQVLLGMSGSVEADAPRCERVVLAQLANWGAMADVESRLVSREQLELAGEGLRGLFESNVALTLSRGSIVIRDPAMAALQRTVARVASASVNVLILGETGVGKDVAASMVHELSARSSKPFVRLNCANLPEPLLESELFGHERGAFTGATVSKAGLLETAQGGTVFLDEVGELALSLQAKLLRVIESHEVMRVGGVKLHTIDVRFVAATNRDLASDVAEGRFRQDLYYRLNCVTLTVPPLRERVSEIEPLALLFLKTACARFGREGLRLSPASLAALTAYAWPGNARELRNVIERAVLLVPGDSIEPGHLGLALLDGPAQGRTEHPRAPEPVEPAGEPVDSTDAERERLASALSQCGGNQSRAAKFLGIPRRTLVRQIARLGLPRPRRPSE